MTSGRTVICRQVYLSEACEFIKFEQIGTAACSEQKFRFVPALCKNLSEEQQRGHTHASANKQRASHVTLGRRDGKTVAKREDDVEMFSCL